MPLHSIVNRREEKLLISVRTRSEVEILNVSCCRLAGTPKPQPLSCNTMKLQSTRGFTCARYDVQELCTVRTLTLALLLKLALRHDNAGWQQAERCCQIAHAQHAIIKCDAMSHGT